MIGCEGMEAEGRATGVMHRFRMTYIKPHSLCHVLLGDGYELTERADLFIYTIFIYQWIYIAAYLFILIVIWMSFPTNKMHACMLSRFSPVRLFATPWTVIHQAPLSMGFSRQEYWSGLPSRRGSSQPRNQTGISCGSCIASKFFTTEPPGKSIKWGAYKRQGQRLLLFCIPFDN